MHPQKKALSCLLVRRDLSKRNRPDATAAALNPPAPLRHSEIEKSRLGVAHTFHSMLRPSRVSLIQVKHRPVAPLLSGVWRSPKG